MFMCCVPVCVQSLQDGSAKYDFIEVMACPGGCIGGGGQPRSTDKQILAVSGTQLLMHVLGHTSNLEFCMHQHGCCSVAC
jgi:iron only hydrogenase large subunit-like protein